MHKVGGIVSISMFLSGTIFKGAVMNHFKLSQFRFNSLFSIKLIASCLLMFSMSGNAENLTGKPDSQRAGDGVNGQILQLQKKAAHFTQLLDSDSQLQLGSSPVSVSSKSYYQRVTGTELMRGVNFSTDGVGALVRVTSISQLTDPSSAKQLSPLLEPAELELSNAQGVTSKQAMLQMVDSQSLNLAHPSLFKNTSAFKVNEQLGKGVFQLKSKKTLSDKDRYLIHVYDKNSNKSFQLTSSRGYYSRGETLSVTAAIIDGANQQTISLKQADISAQLHSPDGKVWDANVLLSNSDAKIQLPINFDANRKPGELWKLIVRSESKGNNGLTNRPGLEFNRVAEIALDIHERTAAIENLQLKQQELAVDLQVFAPGRYEVRAWVYATNPKGENVPAFIQYSANWLEQGNHTFNLPINRQKVLAKNLREPFTVQQLQLLDQTRLSALSLTHNENIDITKSIAGTIGEE